MQKIKIELRIKRNLFIYITPEEIYKAVYETIYETSHINNCFYLGIISMPDSTMQKINNQFRNKDYLPTVLSFPFEQKIDCHKEIKQRIYLGDILLSYSLLKKDKATIKELIVHSIHNLLGK